MIYTPMTMKAMKLAYSAHEGQLDCSGVPYVFHPYHLAEQMDDEISCTVALLHDVIEDTEITADDLKKEFPPEVVEAVVLLTHEEHMDYMDYVRALRDHAVARKVKLADLKHNSDQSRVAGCGVSPQRIAHWKEKYDKALALLLEV